MRSFQLPKCPFCGRKLNFLELWLHKAEGEYVCEKCGNVSAVFYDSLLFVCAALATGASVLFCILYSVTANNPHLSILFLILLPFVLFYLAVPYMIRLKGKRAAPKNTEQGPFFSAENRMEDTYKTKELPAVGRQAQPSPSPVSHGGRRPQTFADKAAGGLEHVGFFMHNVVKSITQNNKPQQRPPQGMRPPQRSAGPQQRPPQGMRPPQRSAGPQQRPPQGMRPPQRSAGPQQRPPQGMRPPQQSVSPRPPQRTARGRDFDVQSIIDELNMRGSAQR